MDKNVVKKFAVWARKELIARVSQKSEQYGVSKSGIIDDFTSVNGRPLTADELSQRKSLVEKVREYGYEEVMDEAAYTWFNRFSALRFMEINGYLDGHLRVFADASTDDKTYLPQLLADAIHLDFDGIDKEEVYKLKNANKSEELFKYLLITLCNSLNEKLPGIFATIKDYTCLLLPDLLLRKESVLDKFVSDVPDEYFDVKSGSGQIEIIGWLYQFYNSEKKAAIFADMKKGIKVSSENIPSATQLFTPKWIVCYMVENSLGRLWLDGHPDSTLKSNWKYYLDEAEQTDEVKAELEKIRAERKNLRPEDIRFFDPCMGSGHILVYAFDVLMQIYQSCGYKPRDAAQSIIKNNLWGLDLDRRAYQLAYFAVMMKAREYDRSFFDRIDSEVVNNEFYVGMPKNIQPNLSFLQDMPPVLKTKKEEEDKKKEDKKKKSKKDDSEKKENVVLVNHQIDRFIRQFENADTYGSLIKVEAIDNIDELLADFHGNLVVPHEYLVRMKKIYDILLQKYDVVCTNPPYMGASNMNAILSDFVKKYFSDSKSDLFASFMERCEQLTKPNCYYAMITQQVWMFLSSYEKLRIKLRNYTTVNMSHLGARAFDEIGGEVVQTTAFVN